MTGRKAEIFFRQLPQITGGSLVQLAKDMLIGDLITDSRKANPVHHSLFFAISGANHDGHQFIPELYRLGCRQFILEQSVRLSDFPEGNFLKVDSSITALQQIVRARRNQYSIPVIGITGSNGKTIVKEWLNQLLSPDYAITKNPGSYNSQLGVPLSVWQMDEQHTLGIFEAGISKPGEMVALAEIIQPTIGIYTNLLTAHDEGFLSRKQKAAEKAKLFVNSEAVIYCRDHTLVDDAIKASGGKSVKLFCWGKVNADVVISPIQNFECAVSHKGSSFTIKKNFSDTASWENLNHCVTTMLYLGYSAEIIQSRVEQLKSLPMRLEMKEGVNGSTIIDDSYSNDLSGLKIALDFLQSQRSKKTVVVLSDLLESGLKDSEWIDQANLLLNQYKVGKLIAVGSAFSQNTKRVSVPCSVFESTEDLFRHLEEIDITNATVLIKGARAFRLERIAQQLQKKVHGTVMEINLSAIAHNLNVYRSKLRPSTKIMAMVKAFGYGSGSHEVASLLQYHKVDYLGVAYADEGKVLRSNGIYLPIMVMNPTAESFQTLVDFKLEPSVYSLALLQALVDRSKGVDTNIHLKLDTGMHRLGFEENDLGNVVDILKSNPNVKVKSIYSHLAGSDEAAHDNFSKEQANKFECMSEAITRELSYPVLKHILNSSGISRLSQYQFDMVRLGIGLYGVDPGNEINNQLIQAVTLRATISQIKIIPPGETIGYGRHGKGEKPLTIATLSIGYADGFSRAFSQGVGKVLIQGKLAPVIGNVCMDMTMVDITGIPANEGDEAIIFGPGLSVTQIASWINTIPYEILTSTSDRVKRVFFAESI
jgi:Alr-MurF fusion protein